jgi:hypothetical protein
LLDGGGGDHVAGSGAVAERKRPCRKAVVDR